MHAPQDVIKDLIAYGPEHCQEFAWWAQEAKYRTSLVEAYDMHKASLGKLAGILAPAKARCVKAKQAIAAGDVILVPLSTVLTIKEKPKSDSKEVELGVWRSPVSKGQFKVSRAHRIVIMFT